MLKYDGTLLKLIVYVLLLITTLVVFYGGCKTVTEPEWNGGVCIDCGVRYELRGVDRMYIKYYVCPKCGREVERP